MLTAGIAAAATTEDGTLLIAATPKAVVSGNEIVDTASTGGERLAPKRAKMLLRAAAATSELTVDPSETAFFSCG